MASTGPDGGTTAGDGNDDYLAAIGGNIRTARELAGMSRATLEREASLRPATVDPIEKGELTYFSDLRAVARALRLRVVDLLPEEPAGGGESPATGTMQWQ